MTSQLMSDRLRKIHCNKHQETPYEQMIDITILDTQTGESIDVNQFASYYWWGEGNGGCDCNRSLRFEHSDWGDDDVCGNERYLIIKTSCGCLNYLNDYYPLEWGGECKDCVEAKKIHAEWEKEFREKID